MVLSSFLRVAKGNPTKWYPAKTSPQKSTERKRTERKRTEMHLSEIAPSPFKRKSSQKINLVRKINNLNHLCAMLRDRNLVDHFRFSVPIDLITKLNFSFIQKITPFPCCCFFLSIGSQAVGSRR